eukprot:scaffold8079_cov444-Prasinococcus_capsulatus_cf.AAC.4
MAGPLAVVAFILFYQQFYRPQEAAYELKPWASHQHNEEQAGKCPYTNEKGTTDSDRHRPWNVQHG